MAQRLYGFLVVFLLMFIGSISGQERFYRNRLSFNNWVCVKPSNVATWSTQYSPKYVIVKSGDRIKLPLNYETLRNFDFEKQLLSDHTPKESTPNCMQPVTFISVNTLVQLPSYTNQLGFFCKKELQLDKITTIPLRFRLGSVEYVNWMERKPNAVKPR